MNPRLKLKLKLKICGMRAPSNIVDVAGLKPDYMGFIYYENSPRYVGEDFEAPASGKKVKRVGVFVNHPVDYIFREVERNSLDAVQLHGHESPEVCAQIKSRGITVIKTFSIGQDFDFAVTKPYQYQVDFFMFDTKGKNYGGTGQSFDWAILNHYASPTPFFLSGGLSEKNMAEISSIKNPALYAIDLNSGVEDQPGHKNIEKIKIIRTWLADSHDKDDLIDEDES